MNIQDHTTNLKKVLKKDDNSEEYEIKFEEQISMFN